MNYKEYNDYELLYMIREKDESSVDVLYEKYLPVIKGLASEFYQKCKYVNYNIEYEDYFQEAAIAFQDAIINYDDSKGSMFYTFVVMCMRRRLLSFIRDISKNKSVSYIALDNIDEVFLEDEQYNVDNIVTGMEVADIVKKAITNLPNETSAVFELRINGFNYREIAILLDIPMSTVEYRTRQGKKLLTTMLHNNYYKKAI